MKIAIINYEMGNIKSVENAFKSLFIDVIITSNIDIIEKCDGVILPGVGAFKDAIKNLKKFKLDSYIKNLIIQNKPFLGICIGLQVLFKYGTEGGKSQGLGIFNGIVEKIPFKEGLKIPHMGWNKIKILKPESKLFKEIKQLESFYFVHSYQVKPQDYDIVSSVTDYGIEIVSSIEKNNCYGVQFHPEKSSTCGLAVLKNFTDIVYNSR